MGGESFRHGPYLDGKPPTDPPPRFPHKAWGQAHPQNVLWPHLVEKFREARELGSRDVNLINWNLKFWLKEQDFHIRRLSSTSCESVRAPRRSRSPSRRPDVVYRIPKQCAPLRRRRAKAAAVVAQESRHKPSARPTASPYISSSVGAAISSDPPQAIFDSIAPMDAEEMHRASEALRVSGCEREGWLHPAANHDRTVSNGSIGCALGARATILPPAGIAGNVVGTARPRRMWKRTSIWRGCALATVAP